MDLSYLNKLLLLSISLALAACNGGGGSSSGGGSPTSQSLSGGGIKGPLVNAIVTVYAVDPSALGFKGAVVGEPGSTNEQAKIQNLSLPFPLAPPYILEFTSDGSTTDIMTGEAPVISEMRTLITQALLDNGEQIYATPLTTMAVDLAIKNADVATGPWATRDLDSDDDGNDDISVSLGDSTATTEELLTALPIAAAQVKSTMGFGMSEEIDIFDTPPLIDDTTDTSAEQEDAAAYRAAVEAVTAVVSQIDDAVGTEDPNAVLSALTNDLADGQIDGKADDENGDSQTSEIFGGTDEGSDETATAALQLLEQDPASLPIPNDPQGRTVGEMKQAIVDEKDALGNDDVTTTLDTEEEIALKPAETNPDIDGDGVPNDQDAFPEDDSETTDTDGDGTGNNADTDDDNDGVIDANDAFQLDSEEQTDTDGDGTGNNADTDDDGDGVEDIADDFPLDGSRSNATDQDDDGWPSEQDADDNDATNPGTTFVDTDLDGLGNDTDTDDDNDGVADVDDAFSTNPDEQKDTDGDGTGDNADTDVDGDGVANDDDAFPRNPFETIDTDRDGVGNNTDEDDDGDGVDDAQENQNGSDPLKRDTDGDGVLDNVDQAPTDPEVQFDSDDDGIDNASDNCPVHYNPSQSNVDGDARGDDCDKDADGDGTDNAQDAFPLDDSETTDTDGDGIGNNTDDDDDSDGVADVDDAFPTDATETTDTDGDGTGDNADTDTDGDGTDDASDAFPFDATEDTDTDGDGIGNNTDDDDDGDGVADGDDASPLDALASTDTDGDGTPNTSDTDDDNDGTPDASDAFPLNANEDTDTDGDGIGDNADTDIDGDGVSNEHDAFPTDGTEYIDSDGDGTGDKSDTDKDNDGTDDSSDAFPLNANEDTDTDGDGMGNNEDQDDDNDGLSDTAEGIAGSNSLLRDTDGDGRRDGADNCPINANADQQDRDGDGAGDACDTDADGDTILEDGTDNCPTVPNTNQNDADGDLTGDACDADVDGDEVDNHADNCPVTSNADQLDADGNGIGDACDADQDQDGVVDVLDNCPTDLNADQLDTDSDGQGNICDTDDDNDGVSDTQEATDGTNPLLTDTDGDGVDDATDVFPTDATETKDTDEDGTGDNADTDGDNDGVNDDVDNCPAIPNGVNEDDQIDTDSDGKGNACDNDKDGDGVANEFDAFPLIAAESKDQDDDTVGDNADNCPAAANQDQADTDQDGLGNACDNDNDGDGIAEGEGGDNCPMVANTSQKDLDEDGEGDACDTDVDGDGVLNNAPDNCPTHSNPDQENSDQADDGGDACDLDDDNDGLSDAEENGLGTNPLLADTDSDGELDNVDNCPKDSNADQADADSNGQGDVCDIDTDGDGVLNDAEEGQGTSPTNPDSDADGANDGLDNCPALANADQVDTDEDGDGNACDTDDDNDTILDDVDNCPTIPNEDQANTNGSELGDACATDTDEDTVPDVLDNCPAIANEDQANLDGDEQGDVCDADDDGDSIEDDIDNCPVINNEDQLNSDSDAQGNACDTDDDNDTVLDEDEAEQGTNPLIADTDADGDDDANDNCPTIANADQADSDSNGVGDACDSIADLSGFWQVQRTLTAIEFDNDGAECEGAVDDVDAGLVKVNQSGTVVELLFLDNESDNDSDTGTVSAASVLTWSMEDDFDEHGSAGFEFSVSETWSFTGTPDNVATPTLLSDATATQVRTIYEGEGQTGSQIEQCRYTYTASMTRMSQVDASEVLDAQGTSEGLVYIDSDDRYIDETDVDVFEFGYGVIDDENGEQEFFWNDETNQWENETADSRYMLSASGWGEVADRLTVDGTPGEMADLVTTDGSIIFSTMQVKAFQASLTGLPFKSAVDRRLVEHSATPEGEFANGVSNAFVIEAENMTDAYAIECDIHDANYSDLGLSCVNAYIPDWSNWPELSQTDLATSLSEAIHANGVLSSGNDKGLWIGRAHDENDQVYAFLNGADTTGANGTTGTVSFALHHFSDQEPSAIVDDGGEPVSATWEITQPLSSSELVLTFEIPDLLFKEFDIEWRDAKHIIMAAVAAGDTQSFLRFGGMTPEGVIEHFPLINVPALDEVIANFDYNRPDTDSDGEADDVDNCPADANSDQADSDGNGRGDVCDSSQPSDDIFTPDNVHGDYIITFPGEQGQPDDKAFYTFLDNGTGTVFFSDGPAIGEVFVWSVENGTLTLDITTESGEHDLDLYTIEFGTVEGGTLNATIDEGNDGSIEYVGPAEWERDTSQGGNDSDGDGIDDDVDNCPNHSNPGQEDNNGMDDGDGIGDACEVDPNGDSDGDGVDNGVDNCPDISNANQDNLDNDLWGDVCDPDIDNDGFPNDEDAFESDNSEWFDADEDGVGDNTDNCSYIPNQDQAAGTGDLGDACDDNTIDASGVWALTITQTGGGEDYDPDTQACVPADDDSGNELMKVEQIGSQVFLFLNDDEQDKPDFDIMPGTNFNVVNAFANEEGVSIDFTINLDFDVSAGTLSGTLTEEEQGTENCVTTWTVAGVLAAEVEERSVLEGGGLSYFDSHTHHDQGGTLEEVEYERGFIDGTNVESFAEFDIECDTSAQDCWINVPVDSGVEQFVDTTSGLLVSADDAFIVDGYVADPNTAILKDSSAGSPLDYEVEHLDLTELNIEGFNLLSVLDKDFELGLDSNAVFSSGARAYAAVITGTQEAYNLECDHDWDEWFDTAGLNCNNILAVQMNEVAQDDFDPVPAQDLDDAVLSQTEFMDPDFNKVGIFLGDGNDSKGFYQLFAFLLSDDGTAAGANPQISYIKTRDGDSHSGEGGADVIAVINNFTVNIYDTLKVIVIPIPDNVRDLNREDVGDSHQVDELFLVEESQLESSSYVRVGRHILGSGMEMEILFNGVAANDISDTFEFVSPDSDEDGVDDLVDNCPNHANPGQEDNNGDGIGDACEDSSGGNDLDGDGVDDNVDNCPAVSNSEQTDSDGDGIGDACEGSVLISDADSDGVLDEEDAFPDDATEQRDTDGDGTGDNADTCPYTSDSTCADPGIDMSGMYLLAWSVDGSNSDNTIYDDNSDSCVAVTETAGNELVRVRQIGNQVIFEGENGDDHWMDIGLIQDDGSFSVTEIDNDPAEDIVISGTYTSGTISGTFTESRETKDAAETCSHTGNFTGAQPADITESDISTSGMTWFEGDREFVGPVEIGEFEYGTLSTSLEQLFEFNSGSGAFDNVTAENQGAGESRYLTENGITVADDLFIITGYGASGTDVTGEGANAQATDDGVAIGLDNVTIDLAEFDVDGLPINNILHEYDLAISDTAVFGPGARAYIGEITPVGTTYSYWCDDDWSSWFESNLDCDNVVPKGYVDPDSDGEFDPVPATSFADIFSTPAELSAETISQEVADRGIWAGDGHDMGGEYFIRAYLQSTTGDGSGLDSDLAKGVGYVKTYRDSGEFFTIGSSSLSSTTIGAIQVIEVELPEAIADLVHVDQDERHHFFFVDASSETTGPIVRRGEVSTSADIEHEMLFNDLATEDILGAFDYTVPVTDSDGDGIDDVDDNCPAVSNSDQVDSNGDGKGDACESTAVIADADSDGVLDEEDAFPDDATEQRDTDGDGTGDNADSCPYTTDATCADPGVDMSGEYLLTWSIDGTDPNNEQLNDETDSCEAEDELAGNELVRVHQEGNQVILEGQDGEDNWMVFGTIAANGDFSLEENTGNPLQTFTMIGNFDGADIVNGIFTDSEDTSNQSDTCSSVGAFTGVAPTAVTESDIDTSGIVWFDVDLDFDGQTPIPQIGAEYGVFSGSLESIFEFDSTSGDFVNVTSELQGAGDERFVTDAGLMTADDLYIISSYGTAGEVANVQVTSDGSAVEFDNSTLELKAFDMAGLPLKLIFPEGDILFDQGAVFSSGANAFVGEFTPSASTYSYWCDDDWDNWFETNLDCDNIIPVGNIDPDDDGDFDPVPATSFADIFSTAEELLADPISQTVADRGIWVGDDFDAGGEYSIRAYLESSSGDGTDLDGDENAGISFVKVYHNSSEVFNIDEVGITSSMIGSIQVVEFEVPELVAHLGRIDSDERKQFFFVDADSETVGSIVRRGDVSAPSDTEKELLFNDIALDDILTAFNPTQPSAPAGGNIGAWLLDEQNGNVNVLVFFNEGSYIVGHTANQEHDSDIGQTVAVSAEHGTYTWDQSSGDFMPSKVSQSDGEGGIDNSAGTQSLAVDGDILTISDSVDGDANFGRVGSDTEPLLGAWLLPESDSMNILVFMDDANYIVMHTNNAEFDDSIAQVVATSAEYGNYTWNASTGAFTATPQGQSDGPGGLSDPGGAFTLTLDGDEFTLNDGTDDAVFKRIGADPFAQASNNDVNFEASTTIDASTFGVAGMGFAREFEVVNASTDTETIDYYVFDSAGNAGRWVTQVQDYIADTNVTTDEDMTWLVNGDGNLEITMESGAIHEVALESMSDTHRPIIVVEGDGALLVSEMTESMRLVPESVALAEIGTPVDLTSDDDVVGNYHFDFDPLSQDHYKADGTYEAYSDNILTDTGTWVLDAVNDTITVSDEDTWTVLFEDISSDSEDVDGDNDFSELVYSIAGWWRVDIATDLGVFYRDKMLEIQP